MATNQLRTITRDAHDEMRWQCAPEAAHSYAQSHLHAHLLQKCQSFVNPSRHIVRVHEPNQGYSRSFAADLQVVTAQLEGLAWQTRVHHPPKPDQQLWLSPGGRRCCRGSRKAVAPCVKRRGRGRSRALPPARSPLRQFTMYHGEHQGRVSGPQPDLAALTEFRA